MNKSPAHTQYTLALTTCFRASERNHCRVSFSLPADLLDPVERLPPRAFRGPAFFSSFLTICAASKPSVVHICAFVFVFMPAMNHGLV